MPESNPYLETLQSPLATGAAPGNPYLDMLESAENLRKTQTAATVTQAVRVNPDAYSAEKRVAGYLGYPVAAVQAMPDETKRQAQVQRVQQDIASSPALQQRFTDADFANLAHDDTGALSNVANWFTSGAKYLVSAPDQKNTLAGDVGAGFLRANRGAAGVFQAAAELPAPLLDSLEGNQYGGNPLRRLAEGFAMIGAQNEADAKALSPAADGVLGGVSSGVQSLTQNLLALPMAFLPGGQGGALAMMTAGTGGQAYQQAREQGLSMSQALPFAASQAAIEYATEKIPLTRLLGDVKASAPLLQTIARQAALEIPGEQVATLLQDMNEWAVLPENKDKPFSAYLGERPNAALQTLIATVVGTGGSVVVARGLESLAGDQEQRQQGVDQAQALQELFKRAAESKLRERAPENFAALVQDMADDSAEAPKAVRFDARTLAETLQQSGLDEAEVNRLLPSVLPQLQEALAVGGEVTVPVGEFTSVVGTALEGSLLQHARIGDNEYSQAEAVEAGKQAEVLFQEQAQRVIEQAGDAAAVRSSAEAVKSNVLEQLNASGRFKPDVNDAYATLVRDFYTTMAGRLKTTPDELFARYPLKVQAEALTGLDQPAFHGSPHRGIEQFTTQKIGTGEGAQAFGYGLYFAGSKAVAEHYREMLSAEAITVDGAPVDASNPMHIAAGVLNANNGDRQSAIADLQASIAVPHLFPEGATAIYEEAVEVLQSGVDLPEVATTPGQLYTVDVPEDSDLLDYDAPLSGQPEKVRTALEGLGFVEGGATGKEVYETLSRQLGSDEAASRALNAAGIPGLRYLDADSRGKTDDQTHNYVIFDDSGVRKTGELYQGPRGTFNPETLTISLLKNADLSTFLHESGHLFLDMMWRLASNPAAPSDVQQDMATVLNWFGATAEQWSAWTAEYNATSKVPDGMRKQHERFAESFERYLLDGSAPSLELQPLFQKFRSWMISVYKSLKDFVAGHPDAQLSDEVRGVFDRLLASQEQIEQAEALRAYAPVFESAEQAGMTPQEWAAYQLQGQEGTDKALDTLAARSVRDLRWAANARSKALKALQKDAAAKRKEMQAEVTAEVEQMPEVLARKALDALQVSPDFSAADSEWKAKRKAVVEAATAAITAQKLEEAGNPAGLKKGQALAKIKREVRNEAEAAALSWERDHPPPRKEQNASEGDLQVIADSFGFSSPDEMLLRLQAFGSAADVIQSMTDQRMLERYGDLVTEDAMARAADEAVHNDARGRFIATGLKALQEAQASQRAPTGKTITTRRKDGTVTQYAQTVNVMVRAAKEFAAQLVARRKLRDLRPGQHTAAEARAGKQVVQAMAKNDTQGAIVAQRDQLLNHYAAKETFAALEEVDRGLAYLKKFDKESVRGNLPAEYLDQIDKLLERVDLRQVSNKDADKRVKLAAWIKSQEDIGIEPTLPDYLLEDVQLTPYRQLTLESFRGLIDSIKQIEHLGRLKSKLLTAKDQRAYEEIRDKLIQTVKDNAQGRTNEARTPTTNLGRALQAVKDFGAAHIKAATWARVFDGGKDGGAFWEYFVRPANERANHQATRNAQATEALTNIMAPLLKQKLGGAGKWFPSVKRSLNKESVLAIALNTGNASNLQRLLGGENWTEVQIAPVLATLNEQDWQIVQAVWDYFETFRPEIGAMEERVFGKQPNWVEPTERKWLTSTGGTVTVKGGYYPIKYDPAASVRAEEHADAEGAKRQLQNAYSAATVRRGFTKGRVDEVLGRPLLYSLKGVYDGVSDVIHYLSWQEWLIDMNRLLKSQSLDREIRHTYGPEAIKQLRSWRDAVAEGEGGTQAALDQALGKLRQSVSVAGLGFNVVSALMQPLGITQSIVRVGARWIGKGVAQYVAAPVAKTKEVNGKSEFMANRARTRFRELNELRNRVQGQSKTKEYIGRYAYWLMMRMQQAVDVPTWIGGYEKAVAEGNDEERAIALADQTVKDSQGGGQTLDLSAIERGGPAQKLFTVFYSFMNTALNLGVASKMTPISKGRFAADMLMLYTVPAVLGSLLKDAITPGDGGGDEDLLKKLAGEQLSFLLGLVVIGREFGELGKNMVGASDRPRDYTGPAGLRAVVDAYQAGKQVSQGEFDDALRKAMINLAGDFMGLPSAQINRSITGVKALAEGKTVNPAAAVLGYKEN